MARTIGPVTAAVVANADRHAEDLAPVLEADAGAGRHVADRYCGGVECARYANAAGWQV